MKPNERIEAIKKAMGYGHSEVVENKETACPIQVSPLSPFIPHTESFYRNKWLAILGFLIILAYLTGMFRHLFPYQP